METSLCPTYKILIPEEELLRLQLLGFEIDGDTIIHPHNEELMMILTIWVENYKRELFVQAGLEENEKALLAEIKGKVQGYITTLEYGFNFGEILTRFLEIGKSYETCK